MGTLAMQDEMDMKYTYQLEMDMVMSYNNWVIVMELKKVAFIDIHVHYMYQWL